MRSTRASRQRTTIHRGEASPAVSAVAQLAPRNQKLRAPCLHVPSDFDGTSCRDLRGVEDDGHHTAAGRELKRRGPRTRGREEASRERRALPDRGIPAGSAPGPRRRGHRPCTQHHDQDAACRHGTRRCVDGPRKEEAGEKRQQPPWHAELDPGDPGGERQGQPHHGRRMAQRTSAPPVPRGLQLSFPASSKRSC
jgi:hypothetical protein